MIMALDFSPPLRRWRPLSFATNTPFSYYDSVVLTLPPNDLKCLCFVDRHWIETIASDTSSFGLTLAMYLCSPLRGPSGSCFSAVLFPEDWDKILLSWVLYFGPELIGTLYGVCTLSIISGRSSVVRGQ